MLQESISSLLSNFVTDGVLSLLRFLEKFRNFFETGISLLLFSFGLLDVVQEEFVSFVINLLSCPLRMAANIIL